MSALDIGKDIVNLASTAGLRKDVIDLLDKKLSLLTDEISTLTKKLEVSESKNAGLERKLQDLQQQLSSLQPETGRLEQGTEQVLKLLFQRHEMTVSEVSSYFGISSGMADYHKGVLMDAGVAIWTNVGIQMDFGSSESAFAITHKGRAYCVKNGLAG